MLIDYFKISANLLILEVASASVVWATSVVVVRFRWLGFLLPHQSLVLLPLGFVGYMTSTALNDFVESFLAHHGADFAPHSLPLKEIKSPHSATVGHVFWAISSNQRAG